VVCEAIEQLRRDALDKPRPELVVKVDRSRLNEHHPIVSRLYAAIDRVLRPMVAAEERRAGAHLIGAARAVTARDQVGLRALNDLLKTAFDQPGTAAAEPGGAPTDRRRGTPSSQFPSTNPNRVLLTGKRRRCRPPRTGLWFAHSPVRLHPGEKRTVTLLPRPEPGRARNHGRDRDGPD